MSDYLRGCGMILLSVILILLLGRNKDMGMFLSLTACAMAASLALRYLKPVLDFVSHIQSIGNLDSSIMETILKIAGIGLIGEIACLVCNDAGNSSLGKSVQLMSGAVILWLSVPLFTAMVELLQKVLGGI